MVCASPPVAEILARLEAESNREAMEQLARERLMEKPPEFQKLFNRHLPDSFKEAWPGNRNTFVVEMAPKLIRRMSLPCAIECLQAWHEIHREAFNAPSSQHLAEVTAALRNALISYEVALSAGELRIYKQLSERRKALFRLTRDLARYDRSKTQVPQGQFILTAEDAALRIGETHKAQAWRDVDFLARIGVIAIVSKGETRKSGRRGKATVWQWNLSLEPWPQ